MKVFPLGTMAGLTVCPFLHRAVLTAMTFGFERGRAFDPIYFRVGAQPEGLGDVPVAQFPYFEQQHGAQLSDTRVVCALIEEVAGGYPDESAAERADQRECLAAADRLLVGLREVYTARDYPALRRARVALDQLLDALDASAEVAATLRPRVDIAYAPGFFLMANTGLSLVGRPALAAWSARVLADARVGAAAHPAFAVELAAFFRSVGGAFAQAPVEAEAMS